MFADEHKNTVCRHGRFCVKWGCGRQHPEGRIVGFDCPHDGKCWGNCEHHHSVFHRNSLKQRLRIQEAGQKRGFNQEKICRYKFTSQCPHGDRCFFKHEPKAVFTHTEPEKKRKSVTCSLCHQKGHNKRSCWISKLPPPPTEWLA